MPLTLPRDQIGHQSKSTLRRNPRSGLPQSFFERAINQQPKAGVLQVAIPTQRLSRAHSQLLAARIRLSAPSFSAFPRRTA